MASLQCSFGTCRDERGSGGAALASMPTKLPIPREQVGSKTPGQTGGRDRLYLLVNLVGLKLFDQCNVDEDAFEV